MRCFLGIQPRAESRRELETWQKVAQEYFPEIGPRWILPENWHITLHFLGSLSIEGVEKLKEVLHQVSCSGGKLSLDKWLAFPSVEKAAVLGVGSTQSSAELTVLKEATREVLHSFSILLESRNFQPHITMARFKSPAALPSIPPPSPPISLLFHAFHLYESTPTPNGSNYKILETFPLSC
jgi:RNA 2',3'-cyclic 3'-phosphodiesterase